MRAVLDAWRDKEVAKATADLAKLVADETDPNLARIRQIRADREQIKLDCDRATFLPLASLESGLNEFASIVRKSGEQLGRLYGNDAVDLLNTAVSEAESRWRELFATALPPPPPENVGAMPAATIPVDAPIR